MIRIAHYLKGMRAGVCACVRVCVRACVCVHLCERDCVRAYTCVVCNAEKDSSAYPRGNSIVVPAGGTQ